MARILAKIADSASVGGIVHGGAAGLNRVYAGF
jgi:hypothetical protein